MDFYVIYNKPADYPDKVVVRRWIIKGPSVYATLDKVLADTLADARAAVPAGLTRIERRPADDAVIVEVWI
jgi:hypothetical protein